VRPARAYRQDRGVADPASAPLSVAEHAAAVAALLPATQTVTLPLSEFLGLALAGDLRAPMSLPPFDNSAMDGYAVRAADVAGAGEERPAVLDVAADIPAGRTDPAPLRAGTAHRIMTGAPMPAGADAVVVVEHTDGGTEQVRIRAGAGANEHVRFAGEDVATGDLALAAGSAIGPATIGLAAAVGAAELPVRRRPRVLVLSTGSELVQPGTPLQHGQIYESNGTMLAAAVRTAGGIASTLHAVPDDVEQFYAALAPHLGDADLLITSGGVSAGAYEVVKDALASRGVDFYKVAMQPGGPQGCGRYEGVPVVTLPGNPVSSSVSFEIFVRPAMRAAMGFAMPERPVLPARLVEGVASMPGRRQYRRGISERAGCTVRPHGGPGSHLLGALAGADCLIVVPEDAVELAAGSTVETIPLD
jgi:molybdopterin molybdotransferase